MPAKQNIRSQLRSATADHHDRVDRLYAPLDLGDRRAYGLFLTAQAEAHLAAEHALDRAGAAAVLADWPQRRRTELLIADLGAMALAVPRAITPPTFAGPSAMLGAIYVLEGSRLGGRLLRRSVAAELPCSFLDAADPAGWRHLLAILEERLTGEAECRDAIAAAIDVFGLFEDSGRRHLGA